MEVTLAGEGRRYSGVRSGGDSEGSGGHEAGAWKIEMTFSKDGFPNAETS